MDVENELRELKDREEIKELKYEYCYSFDERDGDRFASLFSEDAVFDMEFLTGEVYEGRDEIREYVRESERREYQFWAHMAHNPVIDVDGDTATGKWYYEVPLLLSNGSAGWSQGVYDERYTRVSGEWKFEHISVSSNYRVEYDTGWANSITKE